MNNQDILNHIEKLLSELVKCNSQYKLYRLLLEKTNSNLKELNLAPAFFQLVINSLSSNVILTLAKIYEQPKRSGGSIYKLLNKIEQSWKEINNEQINASIINEHREVLKQMNEIIDNLFDWRDKCYAHYDKDYFLDGKNISEDFKITFGNIEQLIDKAKEILNYYYSALTGKYMCCEATNFDDVNRIINILKEHNVCIQELLHRRK
ncbi:hypothetical protein AB2T90_14490 [Clostridium butyricum]|uniref:AbiU2 domain-containing protein n=1 Tax=Clostridium butyricum TaxID=1492 RepID=UPI0006E4C85B|nr:hypothetical protein AK964_20890 [Clostridium butyricum]